VDADSVWLKSVDVIEHLLTEYDVMYQWNLHQSVGHSTSQLGSHRPRHVRRHGVYVKRYRRLCTPHTEQHTKRSVK